MKFVSDFSFTSAPHRPRADWHPGQVFGIGALGALCDPSIMSSLFQDSAGATPVTAQGQPVGLVRDQSGNGNHAAQATSTKRPYLARYPAGGLRNVAHGSAAVDNVAYWPATVLHNGMTSTKLASGLDTDGLPFVDIQWTGTPTGTLHQLCFAVANTRNAASVGQSWTASAIAKRTGGTLSGVYGLRVDTVEETAPATYVAAVSGNLASGEVDTISTSTRVIASGNQVRTAISLSVATGAPIDVTYRVKGLQLELGSTRTAYQHNMSQYDITEAGQRDVWALYNDAVDDALPVTVPDLGTDATIWCATEAGATITGAQTIGAGSLETLRGTRTVAFGAINRALTAAETARLTAYLNRKLAGY